MSAKKTLIRPSTVAAAGLFAGFATARATGRRQAGGAVFAAAGAWCARRWARSAGKGTTAALLGLYAAAMGGSHPLAKRIGAWQSVAAVSALVAAASEIGTARHRAA